MSNQLSAAIAAVVVATTLIATPEARAHCDTMDGPVIAAAQLALAKGDVTPALMWVAGDAESEIREAFARTLLVRAMGPEARDLADLYFFETLVRVHRQGEGEPYLGLKPAGADAGPGIEGADRALDSGSADTLASHVAEEASAGIRERFRRAVEAREHAAESVEAGRKYVAAYVEFLHYTERLLEAAARGHAH